MRYLSPLGRACGASLALALIAGAPVALTYAYSSPVSVAAVPVSVPPEGVTINNQVTLMPITPSLNTATISAMQAIAIARTYVNAQPFPASAIPADVSVPGSIPPPGATSTSTAAVVNDVPSWVVTFTSPTPTNVTIGSMFPRTKSPPTLPLMSHLSVVINAKTGQFVVGFFTK